MDRIVIDTSVFMTSTEGISQNFDRYEFVIPSIVLDELDRLKDDIDFDRSIQARKALRFIQNNIDSFTFVIAEKVTSDKLKGLFTENNDAKILNCCFENDCMLFTYDLGLKLKAESVGVKTIELKPVEVDYKGYKIVEFRMEELDEWYSKGIRENRFDLAINEYLIIKDKIRDEIVDVFKWTDKGFVEVPNRKLESMYIPKTKPMDVYQKCLIDSFFSNQVTLVKGKPGSGKTYLTLAYAFHQIERGNYSRLIVFTNPINTLHSAKLGFYPGTRTEKLLDTSCGNILLGKLSDRVYLESLIQKETIMLIPFSDIRGFDTSGMNAIIWIQEAQNLDVNLMKIALQRVGSDCQIIIDGDYHSQVDSKIFMLNNGMKKVSEVFRGQPFFGQVELQNIYRSEVARIAELLEE